MFRIKALLAALCLSTASVPAIATPTYESSRDKIQDHIELLNTLEEMGVNVQINNPTICGRQDANVAGFWMGGEQLFVICQQAIRNSKFPVYDGRIQHASDDDLDTIRHEAHHVIQDCMDGDMDGSLVEYLDEENKEEFYKFYPEWKQNHIRVQYANETPQIIQLEVEAWAVADLISAEHIEEVLIRECSV